MNSPIERIKDAGVSVLAVFSWVASMSVQDMITFLLACVISVLSIIFIVLGIRNRSVEHRIKKERLKEMNSE